MKIGIQGAIGSFSEEASKKFIENHGIRVININISRGDISPISDVKVLIKLITV